jgi:hypothetical protein
MAPLLAGALLATTVLLPAAEESSTSPLEEVKVDLKELKRGDNPRLSEKPAGPAISVSGFRPSPEIAAPPVAPPATEPDSRTGRRPPANANWLVEAMELQRRAGPAQRAGANSGPDLAGAAVDSSDPAYLLKMYLAQESPNEVAAAGTLAGGDLKSARALDVGTIDRFLRQWIAPRDLALFGLEDGAPTAYADLLPPAERTPAPSPGRDAARPSAPNPFLDALKLDPPLAGVTASAAPPDSPPPAAVAAPAATQDASVPAGRHAPPDSTDDKKHFPQLKRF